MVFELPLMVPSALCAVSLVGWLSALESLSGLSGPGPSLMSSGVLSFLEAMAATRPPDLLFCLMTQNYLSGLVLDFRKND